MRAARGDLLPQVMWNKVSLLHLLLNNAAARGNASWLLWIGAPARHHLGNACLRPACAAARLRR